MRLPIHALRVFPPFSGPCTTMPECLPQALQHALDAPFVTSVPLTDAAGTPYAAALQLTDGAYLTLTCFLAYTTLVRPAVLRWVRHRTAAEDDDDDEGDATREDTREDTPASTRRTDDEDQDAHPCRTEPTPPHHVEPSCSDASEGDPPRATVSRRRCLTQTLGSSPHVVPGPWRSHRNKPPRSGRPHRCTRRSCAICQTRRWQT